MKFGFVKVGTYTPEIKVCDTVFNAKSIIKGIEIAKKQGVELLVFPELCITGYTCGDLFYSEVLQKGAKDALLEIAKSTAGSDMLVFVGMPLKVNNLLYDIAVAISNGKILGFVPKTHLSNVNADYEKRYFATLSENACVLFNGENIPFGAKIIFKAQNNEDFKVCAEISNDLWAVNPPSLSHAVNGGNIIVNLSAESENVGGKEYRKNAIGAYSSRTVSGYIFANAGEGESTTDSAFSGHSLIAENGHILAESTLFENGLTVSDIDLGFISFERSKKFNGEFNSSKDYLTVEFSAKNQGEKLHRTFEKFPFAPQTEDGFKSRAEVILSIQSEGLKKRVKHTNANKIVIGLSGGLDSTLAILVAVETMKKLKRSPKDILAITMPCFGTTSRTFNNTVKLAKALGVTLKKVDIGKAVTRHLKDIKHPEGVLDVTYENAQARERTQVLMDVANMNNGMVLGTGDLSELALGWATYNGDHMSMYGVNCSVPKTLVRKVVKHYADSSRGKLKGVLYEILDTPVSPELLPPKDGDIAQKTEDIVGPYELHDFFLYNMIRRGYSPAKIYYVAKNTFSEFDEQTILKWLKIFVRRFFNQQFKRSCVPDGIKVGSVALSPRGDWRMPSDAISALWLAELENI